MTELALKTNATETDKIALTVFHISIFLIGCPGNLLVLIAFGLSKDFRRRPSNMCLLLLTMGDFLTTLFAPPYYASGLMVKHFDRSKPEFYLRVCKGVIFVLTTTGIIRIFSFTVMSVERFIAIVYPYFYTEHCSRRKVYIAGIVISIHAMLSTLPAVLVEGWLEYYASNESICKYTSKPASLVYTAPMVLFNSAIPTIAVILMNARVFWIARGKLRKVFEDKKQFCQLCAHGKEVSLAEFESIGAKSPPEQRKASTVVLIDRVQKVKDSKRVVLPRIEEAKVDAKSSLKVTGFSDKLRQKKEAAKLVAVQVVMPARNEGNDGVIIPEPNIASQTGGQQGSIPQARRKSSISFRYLKQNKCRHGYSNRGAREIKILLSTLFLAFAFTLTWAPYVMTRLIITIWRDTNSLRLQMFASAGTVINCGLNPIIILLTRKEVWEILRRKLFRRKVNAVSNVE